MNKDKEWLESVIIKELMTNSGNPDMTTYEQGRVSALKYYLKLIEQLDEPEQEKVVVNEIMAGHIENCKNLKLTLSDSLHLVVPGDKQEEVLFARAWLDGYAVEKEKLYYVILVESEDKEKGQALYKDFNFNGDKVVSTHIETFSKRISLGIGNFHFTEQEIKAIDERYWAFAEEVTE